MTLKSSTITLFQENLNQYIDDISIDFDESYNKNLKLFVGVIVQAAKDFHNGNSRQRLNAETFLHGQDIGLFAKVLRLQKDVLLNMIYQLNDNITTYNDDYETTI